jgi:hypothetical protein
MVVRRGWIDELRPGLLYVGVAVSLWFSLVTLHPAYHILLFVLFAQIYSILPIRWAILGSVALTAMIVARGLVQQPGDAFVWISAGIFSVLFGTFFGLWIDSIIRQSEERQLLIEELESTRKVLAPKNAGVGCLRSGAASRGRSTTPWRRDL